MKQEIKTKTIVVKGLVFIVTFTLQQDSVALVRVQFGGNKQSSGMNMDGMYDFTEHLFSEYTARYMPVNETEVAGRIEEILALGVDRFVSESVVTKTDN